MEGEFLSEATLRRLEPNNREQNADGATANAGNTDSLEIYI